VLREPPEVMRIVCLMGLRITVRMENLMMMTQGRLMNTSARNLGIQELEILPVEGKETGTDLKEYLRQGLAITMRDKGFQEVNWRKRVCMMDSDLSQGLFNLKEL
jgi:hypothetical protein